MAQVLLKPGEAGEPWFEEWWLAKHEPTGSGKARRVKEDDPRPRRSQTYWVARARVRTRDGQYVERQRKGATKAEAKRALDVALAEAAQQVSSALGGTVQRGWTIERLAREWLNHRASSGRARSRGGLTANTLAQMEATIRTVILGERKVLVDRRWETPPRSGGIPDLRLHECSRAVLQRWLSEQDEVRSTTSARIILQQMFDLAVKDGALNRNPMDFVSPTKRTGKEVHALTLPEARMLRHVLDPEYRAVPGADRKPDPDLSEIVDFMLGTGVRAGEAFAVRWRDLSLDTDYPCAVICGTVLERRGDLIPKPTRQPFTKQGSDRVVLLPDPLVAILRARYERISKRRGRPSPEETVFATRNRTLREAPNVRRALREALAEYPELRGTTPHTLRRTVATLLARTMGRDVAAAQLGHKGSLDAAPTITDRHYIVQPKVGPDTRAVLSAFFEPWDPDAPEDVETRLERFLGFATADETQVDLD